MISRVFKGSPYPKSINRITVFFAILLGMLALPSATGAQDQTSSQSGSPDNAYIAPLAEEEPYSLVVIGDSIGDGLWAGLTYSFRSETAIKVVKKSRVSTGLVRDDYYDWPAALESLLQQHDFQIAVVLFGTNDRQAIRTESGVYRPGSKQWQQLYRQRVDRITQLLREEGVAIYWVGLPIMRSRSFSRHADLVNRIVSASAAQNGVRYIETWQEFADAAGRYSAYGPDLSGRKRKLRAGDGIHMTMAGYRKLAHAVEWLIRTDLDEADDGDPSGHRWRPRLPDLPTLRPSQEAVNTEPTAPGEDYRVATSTSN